MRSVLVTGTSTGIGEACAARLAEHGWTVFAGVRKHDDGDRLKARAAGDVRPVILDVTDREQIAAALTTIEHDVGPAGLQGLVNNAGVGTGGPFEYLTDDDWSSTFEINLFGVIALTQAALPLLRAGRGRVVHIGSIGGRLAPPGLGPYSATKHAVEALAETQRHEFGQAGLPVRVSLIEPGEVKTAIWAKGDDTVSQIEARLDADAHERYQWLLDQSRGFIDEGRHRGVAADKVAAAVEHALTAPRPKARYLVGPDAKVMGHVVSRLPDRARDAAVRFGGLLWERRGRKIRRRAR